MAKKKTTRKKAVRKKVAKKKATKKKTVRKKAAPKKATAKRTTKKKVAKKKAAKKKSTASTGLGRARIAGTAELDHYFAKDYEAREVFHFLGVKTLKELEQHGPDEIIEALTRPVVQTVDRIRKALALQNRCLAGDRKFAMQFKKLMEQR